MSDVLSAAMSAKGRVAIYGFGFAVIGLLGVYGILTTEQQAAWAAVLLAALGVGSIVFTHITPDAPIVEDTDAEL